MKETKEENRDGRRKEKEKRREEQKEGENNVWATVVLITCSLSMIPSGTPAVGGLSCSQQIGKGTFVLPPYRRRRGGGGGGEKNRGREVRLEKSVKLCKCVHVIITNKQILTTHLLPFASFLALLPFALQEAQCINFREKIQSMWNFTQHSHTLRFQNLQTFVYSHSS